MSVSLDHRREKYIETYSAEMFVRLMTFRVCDSVCDSVYQDIFSLVRTTLTFIRLMTSVFVMVLI